MNKITALFNILDIKENDDPKNLKEFLLNIQKFAKERRDLELLQQSIDCYNRIDRKHALIELSKIEEDTAILWRDKNERAYYFFDNPKTFETIVPENQVPETTKRFLFAYGDMNSGPDNDIEEKHTVLKNLNKLAKENPNQLPFYQDNSYSKIRQPWFTKDGIELELY